MCSWQMSPWRAAAIGVCGVGVALTTHLPELRANSRCSMGPEPTLAVVRVERDTTLSFTADEQASYGNAREPGSVARPVLLPAARVRILNLDSATRAVLSGSGIVDRQPVALIRAAPYGADCRSVPWASTDTFAVASEVSFVRASLLPREHWVGNVPVFLIRALGSYPYPRRGRPEGVPGSVQLASPEAMFGIESILDRPWRHSPERRPGDLDAADRARIVRAMAWARTNSALAEMEPLRSILREAVLELDWTLAQRTSSRLRGTYRVELHVDGAPYAWYFRTQPQLAYRWMAMDVERTTSELLSSPHINGYTLVGEAVDSTGMPVSMATTRANRQPLGWFSVGDRPTAPGNEARRTMNGVFEFMLGGAPEMAWDALEPLARKVRASDSMMMARLGYTMPRRF